ncbi:MAG TPA: TadE/TadG family type IV pilus assembly protein [Alphaproteobacteria bacterium]|nr:TadE/TadG family type IV pilus assembly protein [Alphaproteobacteria bacterium]
MRRRASRMLPWIPTLLRRWRCAGEEGAAAVEMAFALPIFLLFIYGIIELGNYAFTDIAVADAARDGARYAMVRGSASPQPASSSDIATYVKGRLALGAAAQATVSVSYNPNNNPGGTVTVQVSYPFSPLMPGFGYLASMTVSASSQMTITQ